MDLQGILFILELVSRKKCTMAFQNAQELGGDRPKTLCLNQVTQYVLYGLFDEAIRAISLIKNTIAQVRLEE